MFILVWSCQHYHSWARRIQCLHFLSPWLLLFLQLMASCTLYFCIIFHLLYHSWKPKSFPELQTPFSMVKHQGTYGFHLHLSGVLRSPSWVEMLSWQRGIALHLAVCVGSLCPRAQDVFILGLLSSGRINLWELACKKMYLFWPHTWFIIWLRIEFWE